MKQTIQQKPQQEPETARPNLTGIPTQMKRDFEARSGLSFDDVRVHYNSDKPAQLQALAYTQGTQVHVGPGQERHLPHELGHVVQQKAGIVRPTIQLRSVSMNDDVSLEREADDIAIKPTIGQLYNYGQSKVIQRMPRYAGNYGGVTILRIINGGIPQVDQNHYARLNGRQGGQNFVLGWHSMVVFTRQNNGFQIGNVVGNNNIQGPGQAVRAVVTRGVSSCTVVLVSDNAGNIAMLHLDRPDLLQGLQWLQQLDAAWQINGGIVQAFISYRMGGSGLPFVTQRFQPAFPNAILHLFARAQPDVHAEIGIDSHANNLQIFGDLLNGAIVLPQVVNNPQLRLAQIAEGPERGHALWNRYMFRAQYNNPQIAAPNWAQPLQQPPALPRRHGCTIC